MAPDLAALLSAAPRFRSTAVVTAVRLAQGRSWQTTRGSRLRGAAGDWLVSDGHGEWTVDDAVFTRTYRRRPDGRFTKDASVRAVRATEPTEVPTAEGPSLAEAGDWVLSGPAGDLWPVTEEYFRRSYTPVEDA